MATKAKKAKNPITPLPIPGDLRDQLYVSAEKQGRKLVAHILILLRLAMEKEARKA